MSIIAGLVSRTADPLPEHLRKAVAAGVSRFSGDSVVSMGSDHWVLASLDVGAFGSPAKVCGDRGQTLLIAGEPLLTKSDETVCRDRQQEAEHLFDHLRRGNREILLAASGTYCAAYFDPETRELLLIADKLAIRPLYYLVTNEFVAFASAIRILESAGLCSGDLDERGTYETVMLGFPLSDRTCYANVRAMLPAELIRILPSSERRERYFHWDQLAPTSDTLPETVDRLVGKFNVAVRNRLRGDTTTAAFLSGGLDSRAIVAALRGQKVNVLTANFAPPDTQDRVFGELVANALTTRHLQIDVVRSAAGDAYRKDQLREWLGKLEPGAGRPERPNMLWSGDGGSVGLGHVYLNEAASREISGGNTDNAVRELFRYNRLVDGNGALTKAFRSKSSTWLFDAVRAELESIASMPEGRALYLFLMFNDQRRHLFRHFEDMDLQRFEFHLPFFDAGFIEAIVRAPMSWFLYHRFYNVWLKALSPAAASVPWQAYPNHEPCPIAYEQELRYQWNDYYGKLEARRQVRNRAVRAAKLLTGSFPQHLVDRGRLSAAIALTLVGSNSYGHILEAGAVFGEHWARAKGSSAWTGDERGKAK